MVYPGSINCRQNFGTSTKFLSHLFANIARKFILKKCVSVTILLHLINGSNLSYVSSKLKTSKMTPALSDGPLVSCPVLLIVKYQLINHHWIYKTVLFSQRIICLRSRTESYHPSLRCNGIWNL